MRYVLIKYIGTLVWCWIKSFCLWFFTIISSKEFVIALIISILTIRLVIPQFIEQQQFNAKKNVYTKAVELVNLHILSSDHNINYKGKKFKYNGAKCGYVSDQKELNNIFSELLLTTDDDFIPLTYIKILQGKSNDPIKDLEDLIYHARKDFAFKEIKYAGDELFLLPSRCI